MNQLLDLGAGFECHRPNVGRVRAGNDTFVREHGDEDIAAEARRRGLASAFPSIGMVRVEPPVSQSAPATTEVRVVREANEARDWVAVVASAWRDYGAPPNVITENFSCKRAFEPSEVTAHVAYLNGMPASSALCAAAGSVVGIHFVGTREDARGRGMADLVVRHAIAGAFARGVNAVTLQSTETALPLYGNLGFEQNTRYWFYTTASPTRQGKEEQ